jgi:hypothetical protein
MRSAWNVGWPGRCLRREQDRRHERWRAAGRASSASSPSASARLMLRAMRRDLCSSPYLKRTSASASSLETRDEIKGGLTRGLVHPHVDRAFPPEAHPARRVVELRRADAEVGAEAIHAHISKARELLPCVPKVRVHNRQTAPIRGEAPCRRRDRVAIAIDGHDARIASVEDCLRMASRPSVASRYTPPVLGA